MTKYQKHLVPCPSCKKEILDHMTACPFCKAEVPFVSPQGYSPEQLKRLKRILNIAGFTIAALLILYRLLTK